MKRGKIIATTFLVAACTAAYLCIRIFNSHTYESSLKLVSIPAEIEADSTFGKALLASYKKSISSNPKIADLIEVAFLYHANGYLQSAISTYRTIDDTSIVSRYLESLALLDFGIQKEAIIILNSIVEEHDEQVFILLRLGDAYLKSNQLEPAQNTYKRALERAPRNFYALLGLGQIAIIQGKWDLAIQHLEAANAILPGISTPNALLAQAYKKKEYVQKSEEALERSYLGIEYNEFNDPWQNDLLLNHCYDAYLLLANAEKARLAGNDALARSFMEKAVVVEPNDPSALSELSLAKLADGNSEEALDLLSRVIQSDPEYERSYVILAGAHSNSGKMESAISTLERGLKAIPNSAVLHNAIGKLFLEQRNRSKAQFHLEKALKIDPSGLPQKKNLGILQLQDGLESGIELLDDYTRFQPDDSEAIMILCQYLLERNQLDQTSTIVNRYFKAKEGGSDTFRKGYASALQQQALDLTKKGNITLAIEFQQESLTAWPENLEGLANLGMLRAQSGQFEQAIRDLSQYTIARPNSPIGWLNLGKAYLMNGEVKKARSQWEFCISISNLESTEKAAQAEARSLLNRFHQ